MKHIAAILFAATAMLSLAAQAHAQSKGGTPPNPGNVTNPDDPAVKAATSAGGEAAARWLALADADKWDACWDALAPAARRMIDKDSFTASLGAARARYGAVKSRRPRTVTFTHSLPDAPPGDYVVLQYDTVFANDAHAVETVTPMRTPDGNWRVSGYYVR